MGPLSSDAEPTLRGFTAGAKVFGRYTLSKVLGRGGMGVVWRANDAVLGEDVALKFLPDAVRWDPGAYEDLKDETRRARHLTHPNIVRIHDFVEDAGSAAISMELVEGATLTARRLERPNKVCEVAEIAAWLPQLCAALEYAHQEAKVVHRDLKPTNLMLTVGGQLKVADFGVARSMADSITRVSMMTAGTLVYMSPQQAMGEEPSPADDIYAIGATLYELLTGKPPFHTGDVRMQLFQRRPESLAARRKSLGVKGDPIPPAWEAALLACLAKEPGDRPASAMALLRRLQEPVAPVRRWRWRPPTRRVRNLSLVSLALAGFYFASEAMRQPKMAESAHASDATRALGAWNFDGDGGDASGRGLHAIVNRAMPTTDRFGRIDRALYFNGNSNVMFPDSPLLRWGGADPFTAALWVRQNESPTLTGDFWRSEGSTVGSLVWSLGLVGGRPWASLGKVQHTGYAQAEAKDRVTSKEWHHLAIVSDGTVLTLFVDGKEAAREPLGANRSAAVPTKVDIRLGGRAARSSTWALDGAADDLRLWRRALAAAEVATLASRETPLRVVTTRGGYWETDDFDAALRAEFGEGVRLLDWAELKRLHADDAHGWADEMGFSPSSANGFLQRDGERWFEDDRHYFLSRFDGKKPDYYMAHDEIGGLTLALGSWYDTRAVLLAVLPAIAIATEVLPAEEGGRVIRRIGPVGPNRLAAALQWRMQLSAQPGKGVVARIRTNDRTDLRLACETTTDGSLALAVGPGDGGGVSRTIGGSFGEFEFMVVVRNRHLSVRAISLVGRNPLFFETQAPDGFRLADVVGFEIEGGPNSKLATATLVVE